MDLTEALRSTGAVRDFRPEPVPDEVVYRLLDTARFAPNGGNRQAWHVIVVRDPAVKERLRDLYLPGWYEYLAQMEAGLTPFAAVTDHEAELAARARGPELEARLAAAGDRGSPSSSTARRCCSCSWPTCATSRPSTATSTATRWSAARRSTRSRGASCSPPTTRASAACSPPCPSARSRR